MFPLVELRCSFLTAEAVLLAPFLEGDTGAFLFPSTAADLSLCLLLLATEADYRLLDVLVTF